VTVTIVWAKQAHADFESVVAFVEERNPPLAAKVARDVLDRIENVASFPLIAPPLRSMHPDASFRRLVVGEVVVIYRWLAVSEQVSVLSVRSGRQRPVPAADLRADVDEG
jgi:plasmid stabilization system protein ParE